MADFSNDCSNKGIAYYRISASVIRDLTARRVKHDGKTESLRSSVCCSNAQCVRFGKCFDGKENSSSAFSVQGRYPSRWKMGQVTPLYLKRTTKQINVTTGL